MKAMILAAGLGTRLRPYTDAVPKPLVEVAGRPLIAYPLMQLRAAGVRDVVVNVHHLANQMKAALGDGSLYDLRIHYSEEEDVLDTGGGIYKARAWLDDTFVILNADSIHDVPLDAVLRFHRERAALSTLVLRQDARAESYGLLHFDGEARIRRFRGEPTTWPAPLRAGMYAGVCVWEPAIFRYMSDEPFSLLRGLMPPLLAAGEPVYAWEYEGYWRVVDTPEDLLRARREIEGGQRLSYLAGEIS